MTISEDRARELLKRELELRNKSGMTFSEQATAIKEAAIAAIVAAQPDGMVPSGESALDRAKARATARAATGNIHVEGSIYEGMEACLVRGGKTIAHVIKYADAIELAALTPASTITGEAIPAPAWCCCVGNAFGPGQDYICDQHTALGVKAPPAPSEQPAPSREAVALREALFVAGPVWRNPDGDGDEGELWTAEVQTIGGYSVVATVHGATKQQANERQAAILAALQSTPVEHAQVGSGEAK